MLSTAWSRTDPFWTAWASDDPTWMRLERRRTPPDLFPKEFWSRSAAAGRAQVSTVNISAFPLGAEASPFGWEPLRQCDLRPFATVPPVRFGSASCDGVPLETHSGITRNGAFDEYNPMTSAWPTSGH